MKRAWAVYYRDREYARTMGDPCLGYVWAISKDEAESIARRGGMGGYGGVWCVALAVYGRAVVSRQTTT